MRLLASLAAAASLALLSSRAAALSATAELSADHIEVGDQVVLSVAINGSGTAAPRVPAIPDVEIYESGKSQSMSIVNGRVSSSVVYTFVLAPRKAGKFVVPPIVVEGAAPTAPIPFTVTVPPPSAALPQAAQPAPPQAGAGPSPDPVPPSAPPVRGAPDVFVTATVDKPRPLVNEQATLVVRFLTSVPLAGPPQYESPKLTGLLAEPLGGESQGSLVIGGRQYNYSELKTAVFPVQAGQASIGPATVIVQVPRMGPARTGDDFFDRFFNMNAPEARRLQTDPIALRAEPLPPGAPADFSGIVGSLSVEASVDRTKARAGEALNLTVTVTGTGNIKSLPEPKKPDLPSVRFFDSESSVKTETAGGRLAGSKTFKTVMVPRTSGPLVIPPFSVSYYDPAKKAYGTARSAPLEISVAPGDPNSAAAASATAPGVTAVADDVRYLKAPGGRSAAGEALGAFGAAGPWHAAPGLFLAAALFVDWRRRARAADPLGHRAGEARAAALRLLAKAEASGSVAPLGEALAGYAADRLGRPAAGLTLKEALQSLRERGAEASLPKLKALWEELDLLRFAQVAAGPDEIKRLADEIRALTAALDKEAR